MNIASESSEGIGFKRFIENVDQKKLIKHAKNLNLNRLEQLENIVIQLQEIIQLNQNKTLTAESLNKYPLIKNLSLDGINNEKLNEDLKIIEIV